MLYVDTAGWGGQGGRGRWGLVTKGAGWCGYGLRVSMPAWDMLLPRVEGCWRDFNRRAADEFWKGALGDCAAGKGVWGPALRGMDHALQICGLPRMSGLGFSTALLHAALSLSPPSPEAGLPANSPAPTGPAHCLLPRNRAGKGQIPAFTGLVLSGSPKEIMGRGAKTPREEPPRHHEQSRAHHDSCPRPGCSRLSLESGHIRALPPWHAVCGALSGLGSGSPPSTEGSCEKLVVGHGKAQAAQGEPG